MNIDLSRYRAYDPAIGRWWQVDPLAADVDGLLSLTPYHYSFNNPIRYNDPEGDCPCLLLPLIFEAAAVLTAAEATGIAVAAGGATAITYQDELTAFGKEVFDAMAGAGNPEVLRNPASGSYSRWQANSSQGQESTQSKGQASTPSTSSSSSAPKEPKGKKNSKNEPVTLTVSKSKYPQAAQHIEDAQKAGVSTTGTIDRQGTKARRKEALKNVPIKKGKDRDEVPPAVINNGGNGSSVRHIDYSDNRGAGRALGWQIDGLPNGTNVIIKTVE